MFRNVPILLLVLAADPSLAAEPRTDLVGDPLPDGAIARLGTTRYRVRGWHQQVFFMPDGETLIAKGEGGEVIKFFETKTGKPLAAINDPEMVYSDWHADLSPDGKHLALYGPLKTEMPGSKPALRVYDTATRKALWTVHPKDVERVDSYQIRFTPDGKRLITSETGMLRVWDFASKSQVAAVKAPTGYGKMDLSPDGRTVAVLSGGLFVWDWEAGGEARKIDVEGRGDQMVFHPDNKTISVYSYSGTTRAFDAASGKRVALLSSHPRTGWLKFSPDGGQSATGSIRNSNSAEYAIKIHDAKTGKEILSLPTGIEAFGNGCWSSDGKRFAAVGDNRVSVWDLSTGKPIGPQIDGHEAMISHLAFSSDGRLFSSSDDHTIRSWDPKTGKQLQLFRMNYWVRGMDVSHDGSLVVGSALRNDFRIWDSRSGKEVFKLPGHGPMGGLRLVRFSSDDQTLLSYGDDFYLRTWDTLTGKLKAEQRVLPPNPLGRDEDLDESDLMMRFHQSPGSVDLAPDGRTFFKADGNAVRAIDGGTGKDRFKIEYGAAAVHRIALSPDGKNMAVFGGGDKGKLTVWNVAEGKTVCEIESKLDRYSGALEFSPDGSRIIGGGRDPVLRIWNAQTGADLGTVDLPDRPSRIAMSGDSKLLAVAFWDTTVLVYDLAKALKAGKKE